MVIGAVSSALAVPKYLAQLHLVSIPKSTVGMLDAASLVTMCPGLGVGTVIIPGSMWKARRAAAGPEAALTESYETA